MRRESSTVVVLVGDVDDRLLAGFARSSNVSVARAPTAGTDAAAAGAPATPQPAWEKGAAAMREAARRRSTYVIVPDDPLADVAAGWSAMWDLSAGPHPGAGFEARAADALAAWKDKRFELPDYYLVVAPAHTTEQNPDLYLGPLRSVRPRRVAVAGIADTPVAQAAWVMDALRSLEHGPWWPPLGELIDAARHFYAGALAEAQPTRTLDGQGRQR
jgi:hypothetical protein